MNNLTCDIYIYWFAWFVTTPLQHVDQNYINWLFTALQDLHFSSQSQKDFFFNLYKEPSFDTSF